MADRAQPPAPAQPAGTDRGYFDGSAEPNPGGRMGVGWVIDLTDGTSREGRLARPPHPENSNNRVEYTALCALLDAYLALARPGPLLVHGDSELVVRQMRGEYSVRSPGLIGVHRRATALARQIPGGVRFEWVPRSANARADALAAGKTLDQLAAERDPARQVRATTPPDPATVPQALAAQVARLNAQGTMSFKEGMQLRVGGRDSYSRMAPAAVAERVGPVGMAVLAEAFPDPQMQRLRESAARWMARGLAGHLAVRKVQIDAEVSANAEEDSSASSPRGFDWARGAPAHARRRATPPARRHRQ